MEEEIEHLKDIKEDFIYSVEHRTSLTNEEYLNAHRKILAIQRILNELERLQKDNNALKMTHDYDVNMIDEVKGEYVKLSKEFKTLKNDSIPKQVIRDKFKRINETKIKIDKTNARDYMIFGDTERATGWFINIDYIEKILLDVPGYKIGDE